MKPTIEGTRLITEAWWMRDNRMPTLAWGQAARALRAGACPAAVDRLLRQLDRDEASPTPTPIV
jgi:hypothetical protein